MPGFIRLTRLTRLAVPVAVLGTVLATAPAVAAAPSAVIVLPGASSAEGITAGRGTTFYAGDLGRGDIFRGDVRQGRATPFIDAPDGRMAVGMAADLRNDLLFVAGGPGRAYVYNTRTRASVATYTFGDPAASFINDVALTRLGAYFTDSLQAKLFFVPLVHGQPGPFRELPLSGPAADTSGAFNLNGIRAVDDERTLIVAHSALGRLFKVNRYTGASAVIAGVSVPNADGIELNGRRLWVVQNADNKITEWRLLPDLSSGTPTRTVTSPDFHVPTTVALIDRRLAAVNSHFDTGNPPTSPTYEVVVVNR